MHPLKLMTDGAALLNFGSVLSKGPQVLLILNQPFDSLHCFPSLWALAKFKVCADGGYNQLRDYVASKRLYPDDFRPDAILGDLDSIADTARESAKLDRVNVVELGDQSKNDFQKAIGYILETFLSSRDGPPDILVLGALDGRFDHTAASISLLHEHPNVRIWLASPHSVVALVPAGRTRIVIDKTLEGPTCGLVPFAEPATVTTTGLKWNLSGQEMRMGGLISSSNELAEHGSSVDIETDRPLVWTIEFQNLLVTGTETPT